MAKKLEDATKEAEETARVAAAQSASEEAQVGTVTDYLLDHDACRLEYSDGHVDIIPFDDILKLLPCSCRNKR